MEDPEESGSIRHIDSAPIEQDGMGYHAPPEVSRVIDRTRPGYPSRVPRLVVPPSGVPLYNP